jgi:hypothetical protein
MLSKPPTDASGGSAPAIALASNANTSRIAFAYSVRFKRARGFVPGFGARAQPASSSLSSQRAIASSSARSGRGSPNGGIRPVRSLRTAASQTWASWWTARRSSSLNDTPPAKSISLWQPRQ